MWERKTGRVVADLSGGHIGRIFCVGFDGAKVVSCGEDHVSSLFLLLFICLRLFIIIIIADMYLGFFSRDGHFFYEIVIR